MSPGILLSIRGPRSPLIRYGVAVLAVAVTLWLRVALEPFIGEGSYLVSFFLTVVVSSWFGGLGPGILATVLSTVGGWYFMVKPGEMTFAQEVTVFLFLVQVVLVSYFVDAMRPSRRRFGSINESISDGFAMCDSQWRLHYDNEPGASLVGLKPADIIGRSVWDIVPEAVGSFFWQKLHVSVQSGQPVHYENH